MPTSGASAPGLFSFDFATPLPLQVVAHAGRQNVITVTALMALFI